MTKTDKNMNGDAKMGRTVEEKKQMIDEGCELFFRSVQNIGKSRKSYSIRAKSTFAEDLIISQLQIGTNQEAMHTYTAAATNFCKLAEIEPSAIRNDKDRRYIDYKGIRFVQLGSAKKNKYQV